MVPSRLEGTSDGVTHYEHRVSLTPASDYLRVLLGVEEKPRETRKCLFFSGYGVSCNF